jgi:hypothetical protein
MRALSAPELLSVWEHTYRQSATYAALALLSAACPESPLEELARLSIGDRDVLLLTLRESLFGSELTALSTCPNCGDHVELALSIVELRGATTTHWPKQPVCKESSDTTSVSSDGYRVRFRSPNSLDLAAIEALTDPEEARGRLLQRCVVSVEKAQAEGLEASCGQCEDTDATPAGPGQVDLSLLPGSVLAGVAGGIEQACSETDFKLGVDCHECGHHWETAFDIARYLVREVDAWAQRVVRDVHTLAAAYGWSETEILTMSPARRQVYLDLAGHR